MMKSLVTFFTEYEKNQQNKDETITLQETYQSTLDQTEEEADDENTLEYINSINDPIEKAKALKNAIEYAKQKFNFKAKKGIKILADL